jgi:hypothetical protein
MVLVAFAIYRAKIGLFVVCLSFSQTSTPPPHLLLLTTYTLKIHEPRSAKGKGCCFVACSFRVQIPRPIVITKAFILFLSPGIMEGYLEASDCTDWRSEFQSGQGQEISYSPNRVDLSGAPPSLLFNEYHLYFPGVMWPEDDDL